MMKLKPILLTALVVLLPITLFWSCGKSTSPVGPSSASSLNITIPMKDSHGNVLGASQNTFIYYITGKGAPVTGSISSVAASSISSSYNFSVGLDTTNYDFISVQINNSSTGQVLAVGAAKLAGNSSSPVTLGPVNRIAYTVTAIPSSDYYNFQTALSASVSAGMDIQCSTNYSSIGFELRDLLVSNNIIAYMGNGNFSNYLTVPPTTYFQTTSAISKGFVKTGVVLGIMTSTSYSLAVGDVYCVKLSGGGYAWVQITGAGTAPSTGPSFIFRLNTTLPYCGYQNSTADSGILNSSSYAPQAVFPSTSFTANSYGIAVYPSTSAATSIFVTDAGAMTSTAFIHVFNPSGTQLTTFGTAGSLTSANGLAINSAGSTIFVSDPRASSVKYFSLPSLNYGGSGGNGTVSLPDTTIQAQQAKFYSPEYIAVSPLTPNNVFVTDAGTNGFADVLVMQAPISFASAAVTYWNGQIGNSPYSNGIATDGISVYVADVLNNKIETYNLNGVLSTSWTTDNNASGAVAFLDPQGIALDSGAGLLFITDTGNNRIVEMTTSGIFRATWSNLGSSVSPSTMNAPGPIAVDGANPPNVYVVDTNNKRVLSFKGL